MMKKSFIIKLVLTLFTLGLFYLWVMVDTMITMNPSTRIDIIQRKLSERLGVELEWHPKAQRLCTVNTNTPFSLKNYLKDYVHPPSFDRCLYLN